MEFWFAVTPSSSALIAHSTAGQCRVVNRAPIPSVLCPSLAPAVGKIVEAALCSWIRFFKPNKFSKVAGNAKAPPSSPTPSCSAAAPSAPARGCNRQAQSPVAICSTSCQAPAAVSNPLFRQTFDPQPPACRSVANAGQSRQKSGDTQGFWAMRNSCSSRKRLTGVIRSKSEHLSQFGASVFPPRVPDAASGPRSTPGYRANGETGACSMLLPIAQPEIRSTRRTGPI